MKRLSREKRRRERTRKSNESKKEDLQRRRVKCKKRRRRNIGAEGLIVTDRPHWSRSFTYFDCVVRETNRKTPQLWDQAALKCSMRTARATSEKILLIARTKCQRNCETPITSALLYHVFTNRIWRYKENENVLRAGITYSIFTDTYITDLYFSVYCIYFFEPENFFCK